MKALFGLLAIAAAGVAWPQALPGVLIVQGDEKDEIVAAAREVFEKNLLQFQRNQPAANSPVKPGAIPKFDAEQFKSDLAPVPLEDIAAQEFDEDGRLTPIAWSFGDPIFRSAVDEKLIPNPSDNPTLDQVRQAMGKLKTGYHFQIYAFGEGDKIWTLAKLYRGSREIWKDEVRSWQSQVQAQFDEENARRSIVRSWIQILGSGPLKDLPQRRRIATPAANNGLAPPVPAVAAPKAADDGKQVLLDAMKLLAQKQFPEAVNLLRDAVDAQPLDPERRDSLISTLMEIGEPVLAAQEARRAAQLMPERIEFWVGAARAWMQADRPADALQDLNEAVARDADGGATRLLLGEVQIAEGKLELAAESLGKAIEGAPTAYAHRLRAFALAGTGHVAEAAQERTLADQAEPQETEPQARHRFRLCQKAAFSLAESLGAQIRLLTQRARVVPHETGLAENADQVLSQIRGLIAATAGPAPEAHKNSSERLQLALYLLSQSAAGVRGALDKPDEDALTDAAIDLGEALKALESARSARAEENG